MTSEWDFLIGAGAGGVTFMGVASIIVQRYIKKVVNHVEDPTVHLRPGNGYVSQDNCDRVSEQVLVGLKENREAVVDVHKRIDHLMEQQAETANKILTAISQRHVG